jgi:hypothetical protein
MNYFLLDFAFSARIFAHLARCAAAILRLPAADMFPPGAVADREFVGVRREFVRARG